jgi:uncharacterized protein (DUF488 family)
MILTIGHSNHEVAQFIDLLVQHEITAVADVRSSPHSGRFPQYCQSALRASLRQAGIAYVFLGDALGGRPAPSLLTPEGYADYPRMSQKAIFLEGLGRLRRGADIYNLAVMCAEADPADCHRALLIGRQFAACGLPVEHIHRDGSVESHTRLESRLLELAGLAHDDLFTQIGERLDAAYRHRAARVAWRAEMQGGEE